MYDYHSDLIIGANQNHQPDVHQVPSSNVVVNSTACGYEMPATSKLFKSMLKTLKHNFISIIYDDDEGEHSDDG